VFRHVSARYNRLLAGRPSGSQRNSSALIGWRPKAAPSPRAPLRERACAAVLPERNAATRRRRRHSTGGRTVHATPPGARWRAGCRPRLHADPSAASRSGPPKAPASLRVLPSPTSRTRRSARHVLGRSAESASAPPPRGCAFLAAPAPSSPVASRVLDTCSSAESVGAARPCGGRRFDEGVVPASLEQHDVGAVPCADGSAASGRSRTAQNRPPERSPVSASIGHVGRSCRRTAIRPANTDPIPPLATRPAVLRSGLHLLLVVAEGAHAYPSLDFSATARRTICTRQRVGPISGYCR